MLYDLLADFYEKSSDRHPKYIVLMGTYNENTFDEMKILGFQEDSDSNASFQDYVMDGADENFLQEYTKDGYQSEMLDVLYSDVNYEKIQVRALADEALDDEGRHAPRGVVMGDMFVHFTESNPDENGQKTPESHHFDGRDVQIVGNERRKALDRGSS